MKILTVFFLIALSACMVHNKRSGVVRYTGSLDRGGIRIDSLPFYDVVIDDIGRHTYFVSVDMRFIDGEKINYMVRNEDLFFYLNDSLEKIGLEYRDVMKEKLVNDLPIELNIDQSTFDSLNGDYFYKVVDNKRINAIAEKGKDRFLKKYVAKNRFLKDRVLRDSFYEKRIAIIQKLFEFKIPCHNDPELGYLIIDNYIKFY